MNYRKERFAPLYRERITEVLVNGNNLIDVFDLNRNGDIEYIYIEAQEGSLSLFKKSSNDVSYIMINNLITTINCEIDEFIYDLASFLDHNQIAKILYGNMQIFPSIYCGITHNDIDRGYISFMVVVYNNHLYFEYPDDGFINLKKEHIPYMLEYLNISTIEELFEEYSMLRLQD